ncbi:MAG TPA: arginine--tRNA ligase [Chitinophagales bacterium]|nr:arginine--tRNA ligase [Chitinophagales bacterium]
MTLEQTLKQSTADIFKEEYGVDVPLDTVTINITKKEHEGDYTIVVFPLTKVSKKSPEQTAELLGAKLQEKSGIVGKFNVIKGFLNLSLTDAYWTNKLKEISGNAAYGTFPANHKKVVLEYCGPNTNKPLHIGHIRNMLLGYSMSEILKAAGYDVTKVNIYNDRGINISKSMVVCARLEKAYGRKFTPTKKGDHFVGDFYVQFNHINNEEVTAFLNKVDRAIIETITPELYGQIAVMNKIPGLKKILDVLRGFEFDDNLKDNPDVFLRKQKDELDKIELSLLQSNSKEEIIEVSKKCIGDVKKLISEFLETSIFSEAVDLVRKWENGDQNTLDLWNRMNGWVYEGFKETFDLLGVDFQKDYYESKTYMLGKDIVEEGLQKNVFKKRADGAVIVDLTPDGLDEKVLLRPDGTSIYITQDLATAELRYKDFGMDKMIYVVANEQDYHFKVLKLALQKLGKKWADGIYHLSYALVESPTGRFKSREGKTADADDLAGEVLRIAEEKTKELGKIEGFTEEQAQQLYKTIGLGALKYFVLRVNPYKKIIFNPEESIDFHGQTGPFIQYTHARVCAIMRKAGDVAITGFENLATLAPVERELVIHISEYENTIRSAADKYDPSEVASYVYTLAKLYNKFYHELPILNAATDAEKNFRIGLSKQTGILLKKAMKLLGIDVPEKM